MARNCRWRSIGAAPVARLMLRATFGALPSADIANTAGHWYERKPLVPIDCHAPVRWRWQCRVDTVIDVAAGVGVDEVAGIAGVAVTGDRAVDSVPRRRCWTCAVDAYNLAALAGYRKRRSSPSLLVTIAGEYASVLPVCSVDIRHKPLLPPVLVLDAKHRVLPLMK